MRAGKKQKHETIEFAYMPCGKPSCLTCTKENPYVRRQTPSTTPGEPTKPFSRFLIIAEAVWNFSSNALDCGSENSDSGGTILPISHFPRQTNIWKCWLWLKLSNFFMQPTPHQMASKSNYNWSSLTFLHFPTLQHNCKIYNIICDFFEAVMIFIAHQCCDHPRRP